MTLFIINIFLDCFRIGDKFGVDADALDHILKLFRQNVNVIKYMCELCIYTYIPKRAVICLCNYKLKFITGHFNERTLTYTAP